MCGLTGILSFTSQGNFKSYLYKMTSSLAHRGPNDEGVWSEGHIGLGHRRLSIIDLSSNGSQPMQSHCGRFVIVFNGEIYNHLHLRNELEKDGLAPTWRGHSDTETLLEAIKHWGIDKALRLSHGMFAFALWDKNYKKLSLARDRIGEKPLFWGWAGKNLIFGSELKALRSHPECTSQINQESLCEYFRYMYVPAPLSIYENIYKLEPGTILSVDESPPGLPPNKPIRPGERYGSLNIRSYWQLNSQIETGVKDIIKDENEAVSKLKKVLGEAVAKQMISDVPLGAFLSGGVDSSIIVALMQEKSKKPIQTFTIGFQERGYDESKHALKVARHLGTNHTEVFLSDSDARDTIPNLPLLYDEPFADSSQIPTHLVCRIASEKVSVALSGDGADEIFGGYNRYLYGPKLWRYMSHIPFPLRKFMGKTIQMISENSWDRIGFFYNKFRSRSNGLSHLGNKVHKLGERLNFINSIEDLYTNFASNWIEPEKLFVNKITNQPLTNRDDMFKTEAKDAILKMMSKDMHNYLPDDILCKVDRAAMSVSLETRAPFLDPNVIELSTRIPVSMKIKGSQSKWALRQVLYDYVPRDIIDRPKSGFAIPIGLWLRGPLRDWAEDLLSINNLKKDGIFDTNLIRNTWNEHLSLRKDSTSKLWSILMFQSWRRYWS